MLVLMLVFGIHCNVFVVLANQLKICKSIAFFRFLQNKMCAIEKLGVPQRFCAVEHARSVSGVKLVKVCFT